MSKRRLRFIFVSLLFLLTACGSGSSGSSGDPSSGGSTTSSGLPNDINGLIVLNIENDSGKGNLVGTYMIDFEKGQVKTHEILTSGKNGINPYAHDRNNITYAEPCNGRYSRLKVINEKRLSSAEILPCSSELIKDIVWSVSGINEVAKYSPDKSKIALEVRYYGNFESNYLTVIFDVNTKKKLSAHIGYDSPEWLPNGRLLLSSSIDNDKSGIFITSKDFKKVTRIDQGLINQSVSFLNVNPSGDRLIFTMSGQLWMMNIDNNHTLSYIQKLVSINGSIQSPTWSPDGKYIAYLTYAGYGRSHETAGKSARNITFSSIDSKKSYVFDTSNILPLATFKNRPGANLSWVK